MTSLIDLSGNNLRINYSNTIQNILCTSTNTIFCNEIDLSGGITAGVLQNSFNYTSDMIGYTITSVGTDSNFTPTSGQIYNVTSFTLTPGIYIIYLFTNMVTGSTLTNVTKISVGLTTTSASFTGGTGEIITMSNTVGKSSTAAAGRICGKTLTTLSVPTEATHYFVAQIATSPMPTWNRTASYCIYTRIA